MKRKMLAGINRETLVLWKFTETEKQNLLRWKHDREFEYRGEMYDIVETEVRGDTTYYWCFWDHEETLLNKQLAALLSFAMKSNPKKQENQKRLATFFKSLYYTTFNKPDPFIFKEIKRNHLDLICLFRSQFYSPAVPPPKA